MGRDYLKQVIILVAIVTIIYSSYGICQSCNSSSIGGDIKVNEENLFSYASVQTELLLVPTWARLYGGIGPDVAYSVKQTSDGGYIIAGSYGAEGFWVLKLNSIGSIVWQKLYGGEEAVSIQQTFDKGYVVAGYTYSYGAGAADALVIKLNANGKVIWQKTYGGTSGDWAFSIQQISDGGYIVAGATISFGAGSSDMLVLKLDANGEVIWQKTYGGSDFEAAYSVQQTLDGGYIIAGENSSFGVSGMLVLKLDANGEVIWQYTYGGNGDVAYSAQQTLDGGYIIAGDTLLFGAGNYDAWVMKLNSNGEVIWQKTYGGSGYEKAYSIQQTTDGGYIVAGETTSFGAGGMLVLKLNANGEIIWQKTYGGDSSEYAWSIQQTIDGGYIVAGCTYSFGVGDSNVWVLKIDANGGMSPSCSFIYDSNAIAENAAASVFSSSVLIFDSTAIVMNPTAPAVNSSAITTLQCSGNACPAPSGLSNNSAADLDTCSDSGVRITWAQDPANWGDGGSGTRTYNILRNGNALTSGLNYGTTSYIDTTGINGQTYLYALRYVNGCGISTITTGIQAADNIAASPSGFSNNIAMDLDPCSDSGVIIRWLTDPTIWGDSGTGTRTYTVLRHSMPIATLPNSTASWLDTSGMNDNVYTYSIRYNNGCGLNSATTGIQATDYITCALVSQKPAIDDSGGSIPNGIIEPDEIIRIIGSITNMGSTDATSVSAVLSTPDPINITDSSAIYPDIASGMTQSCTDCYSIIAPSINRQGTHWDVNLKESSTCTSCSSVSFNFRFHIGESFSDVPPSQIFYSYIEKVLHSGAASGCTATTYCPSNLVQRQQMAKFICNSMNISASGSCLLTSCNGTFADVPASNPFCPFIEALYTNGIVVGCQATPLNYCPNSNTQRQAMAKFICNGMSSANPGSCIISACAGIFNDVPATNLFCSYIEALYNANVIAGCGPSLYCPTNNVARDQMSKFLVNAFGFAL